MEAKKIYNEEKKQFNVKAIMTVLLAAGFLSLFNETILNVALPKLMVEMQISATTVQWLTTGYILIVTILVPVTAFLINTFTTKQLFLSAMLLFLIGIVLATLSASFSALLISRMIQATGTAMLIPIMINTALSINPPEKHGSVMGLCSSTFLLGPALGPIASGILLQFFHWHSLFIILIPLVLICMIMGSIYLENTSVITKPKIDYLSILLSTIGFGGIVYGISTIGEPSVNKLNIAIILAVGLIALILFAKRQLSLKQPMLELRAFKYPLFTVGVLLIIILQMVQFSMNIVLPMLLQNGFKLSSLMSALVLLPAILLNGFMTPVSGKIYDKFGGKVLIPAGLLIMCIFIGLLSRISASTPIITITILYCFVGIGIAMTMSPSQTTSISQLAMKNKADGVAITNTSIQLGAAIGAPLFIGLMSAGQNSYLKNLSNSEDAQSQIQALYSGFSFSLTVAVIIIIVGFILSLSLRRNTKNTAKSFTK
jgi:DHA2 family lincomycin resistance protein-like MFS transporter